MAIQSSKDICGSGRAIFKTYGVGGRLGNLWYGQFFQYTLVESCIPERKAGRLRVNYSYLIDFF